MQTKPVNIPVEMVEADLDTVSGGIKIQFELPPTGGVLPRGGSSTTTSGHYTQMVWAKTR